MNIDNMNIYTKNKNKNKTKSTAPYDFSDYISHINF